MAREGVGQDGQGGEVEFLKKVEAKEGRAKFKAETGQGGAIGRYGQGDKEG